MKRDWVLVVGLRSFPVDESLAGATTTGRLPSLTYDRHWTLNNTWSAFAAAMTFPTEDEAVEYLNNNRASMEVASVED